MILKYITNGYNNEISPNIIAIVLGLKRSTVSSFWCRFKNVEGLPPKIKIRKSKISGPLGIRIKDYISETPKTILKAANDTISPSKRISRTTLRRFLERNKIVKKKSILNL